MATHGLVVLQHLAQWVAPCVLTIGSGWEFCSRNAHCCSMGPVRGGQEVKEALAEDRPPEQETGVMRRRETLPHSGLGPAAGRSERQCPLCSLRTVKCHPGSSNARTCRDEAGKGSLSQNNLLSPKHEAQRPLQRTRPAAQPPPGCCYLTGSRLLSPCWAKETHSWGQVPALSFPC